MHAYDIRAKRLKNLIFRNSLGFFLNCFCFKNLNSILTINFSIVKLDEKKSSLFKIIFIPTTHTAAKRNLSTLNLVHSFSTLKILSFFLRCLANET